jgi:dephospho-CoA kinase
MPRTIIGFTGAVGSGCTTAATHLRDIRKFHCVRLSDVLRAAWRRDHKRQPSRSELQRLGDNLRQAKHSGILTQKAFDSLKKTNHGKLPDSIVVDGIRNVGEVEHLRSRYGYRVFVFTQFKVPKASRRSGRRECGGSGCKRRVQRESSRDKSVC